MNEATDALMATLGEYDALWDGELLPEIYDAELYDCPLSSQSKRLPTAELPVELFMIFNHNLTQRFDRADALVTLMATLGEYDALWDGELFPEIVDAEFHDCPDEVDHGPFFPAPLCHQDNPSLIQVYDRYETLMVLMKVVKCYVGTCIDAPLFSEEVDAQMYDCPIEHWPIILPQDWPSVESLK